MFDKSRYITRGINESIGIELQIILWGMINDIDIEKDYLQVFNIIPIGKRMVKIIHSQEVPHYKVEQIVMIGIESETKIFVVDAGSEGSVMMLRHEY